MEAPGFITLLLVMFTLPSEIGLKSLPWENWAMATLFTIHYLYRAIISPLIAPSMSPIHIFVWFLAVSFQLLNSISIAGYLAGYGPITRNDWVDYKTGDVFWNSLPGNRYVSGARLELGLMIWAIGFLLSMWHDDELREIRRAAARNHKKRAAEADASTGKGKAANGSASVEKVYLIPKNGFFNYILYPHYLFEWVEWAGFLIMGGSRFGPGRTFVINEIATMLPRAVRGRWWYIDRFGKEKVGNRKAVIPGLL